VTGLLDKVNRFAESFRPRLYLWIAVIVIIPRVAFLAISPDRNAYGNSPGEMAVARNLASGHGYLNASGKPDSDFNPGYPMLLSVSQRFFGDSLWPIKIAHIAFDAATALIVTWTLVESCPALTLLLFGLAFAFHPLFLLLCNNVNDEPLLMFLIATSFAALYRAVSRPTHGRFALAGLLVGLAIFTKSTAIFLPLFLAVMLWLTVRRTNRCSLSHWAMYLVTCFAVLLPWSYRNYVTLGHFAFNIHGIGQNLWFGSDPRIFTRYGKAQREEAASLAAEMTARGIPRPSSSNVFDREHWQMRMAIQKYKDLLHDPVDLAYVLWLKCTRSLYASEDRPSGHLPLILLQLPTLLLAVFGIARLWKRAETRILASLLALYVLYYYSVVSIGMPMVRYLVPAVPFLLAAAAAGATALLSPAEFPAPRFKHLELVQS